MKIVVQEGDGTMAELDTALRCLEATEKIFYPCPACGRLVDASHAEEILIHHEHVLASKEFGIKSEPIV